MNGSNDITAADKLLCVGPSPPQGYQGREGVQFVATAVAEKVAALRTASYFAEHRGRANWAAFDRLMARPGGEPPRAGDELPENSGDQ